MARTEIKEVAVLDEDFLSEAEHDALGDTSPHHAKAHTLSSATDHTDVDPAAKADGYSLYWDQTAGKHVYGTPWAEGAGASKDIEIYYTDSQKPYIEFTTSSWTSLTTFIYPGTANNIPFTVMKIIGSRAGTTGNSQIRVYDITNGVQIASILWTASEVQIYETTSIGTLPTGEAMFEVQVMKSSGAASKGRIHTVVMR